MKYKTLWKLNNKPLHIIIDGSDKVGKSTVCQLLSKKLKIPIIKMQDMPKHFKVNPESASEIYNKTIVQFKDFGFIQDRGYPSSLAYSTMYNRKYSLDYINKIAKDLEPKVFILEATPREKDPLVSSTEQNQLRDIYLYLTKVYNWEVIFCDNLSPEQICNQILKTL